MAIGLRFHITNRGVLEMIRFRIEEKILDFLKEMTVIRFQGQDVIGLLVDNQLGDVFLAPHRIDGDDSSYKSSTWSSAGMAVISLDLASVLGWPRLTCCRCPRADHVNR